MKIARTVAVGTALSAALFLAACGQEKDSATDPTSAPPTTSPTSAETTQVTQAPSADPTTSAPTTTPPEAGDFGTDRVAFPKGRSRMGGDLGPAGTVSVTHHDGYDSVVWEFTGTGKPQYVVEYVDQPIQEGSGDPVDVAGDAFIQVTMSSVSYPENPGQDSPQPAPADQLDGTVIAEAGAIDGGFEGYGQTWIGVTGEQRPFRVTHLSNPTRIVVDVVNTP